MERETHYKALIQDEISLGESKKFKMDQMKQIPFPTETSSINPMHYIPKPTKKPTNHLQYQPIQNIPKTKVEKNTKKAKNPTKANKETDKEANKKANKSQQRGKQRNQQRNKETNQRNQHRRQ